MVLFMIEKGISSHKLLSQINDETKPVCNSKINLPVERTIKQMMWVSMRTDLEKYGLDYPFNI